MRIDVPAEHVRQVFARFADQPAFRESAALAEKGHMPVEMLQAMALRPEILKAFAATGEGVYPGGLLDRTLKEKVILKISRLNACQFCTLSHESLVQQLGVPAAEIEHLDDPAYHTEREVAALEYAVTVAQDSNSVTDASVDRLRQHFSDAEIVELTFLAGMMLMLNAFNNALGVEYRGEYESA